MGKIYYISSDGSRRVEDADALPDNTSVESFIAGDRECVWVLFKERRTCMFVNENGIALGLPINSTATEIYRDWPLRQGMDVSDRHIHGNVIVFEDIAIN